MDLLELFRALGLFTIAFIGVFRLRANFMRKEEKFVVIMTAMNGLYLGSIFTISELPALREFLNYNLDTHLLIRISWLFTIVSLIFFMLYYRKFTIRR